MHPHPPRFIPLTILEVRTVGNGPCAGVDIRIWTKRMRLSLFEPRLSWKHPYTNTKLVPRMNCDQQRVGYIIRCSLYKFNISVTTSQQQQIKDAHYELPQDCRAEPASPEDLAAFESEFGVIPADYRWYLAECGGG